MSDDALIGKQLGEYQIESLLGQGGMARVYCALDVRLKRHVVIKVIDPSARSNPDYISRFEREAQIIARLDHPHIVRLYRFDEQDGWLYMAMQQIEGADLGVVLAGYRADHEFMDANDALRITHEICSALDYAHDNGIIHRDVKPANILLDREGRTFLSDFGLALITEVGTRGEIFGSAHYIAPEQAVSSAKAVAQSDLYAMGVILYEIFTGDVPFKAATPLDIALLHMSEPPVPPRELRSEINPELEAVILRALAKKPEERYPTGAALVEALDQALKARTAIGLSATRLAVPRKTIPERVSLELGQPPLPPTPAAVAESATAQIDESASPVTTESTAAPATKRPMLYIGALIGIGGLLLMLACLAVFLLPALMNSWHQASNPSVAETQTHEASELIDVQINGTADPNLLNAQSPALTASAIAAETLLPIGPPVTQTPVVFQLLIIRSNDSLILLNQSASPFLLAPIRVNGNKSALNGANWGVPNLESGECVGAWREGTTGQLPNGLNCKLVGVRIELKKKDWFGNMTLNVSYDGQKVITCDKNQTQCLITIASQ